MNHLGNYRPVYVIINASAAESQPLTLSAPDISPKTEANITTSLVFQKARRQADIAKRAQSPENEICCKL